MSSEEERDRNESLIRIQTLLNDPSTPESPLQSKSPDNIGQCPCLSRNVSSILFSSLLLSLSTSYSSIGINPPKTHIFTDFMKQQTSASMPKTLHISLLSRRAGTLSRTTTQLRSVQTKNLKHRCRESLAPSILQFRRDRTMYCRSMERRF